MFTTRHYVAIARTIHQQWNRPNANREELLATVAALGSMFKTDNSRFNYGRFRMACTGG